jgi:hypothetical protein
MMLMKAKSRLRISRTAVVGALVSITALVAGVLFWLSLSAKPQYEATLNAIALPSDYSLIDSRFQEGGPLFAPTLTRRYRVRSTRATLLAELRPALQKRGYELQSDDLSDYHVAVNPRRHPGVLTIRFYPLDPHRVNNHGSVLYEAMIQYPTAVGEVSIKLSP